MRLPGGADNTSSLADWSEAGGWRSLSDGGDERTQPEERYDWRCRRYRGAFAFLTRTLNPFRRAYRKPLCIACMGVSILQVPMQLQLCTPAPSALKR